MTTQSSRWDSSGESDAADKPDSILLSGAMFEAGNPSLVAADSIQFDSPFGTNADLSA
jgi:hypothetical protein